MAPEFEINAQDIREDLLSKKSDGVVITREGLEEARQKYLDLHSEHRESADLITTPTL